MPPIPNLQTASRAPESYLPAYPAHLPSRLKVVLFPLDITERHVLTRTEFNSVVEPLIQAGSPLSSWVTAWMESTYRKIRSLHPEGVVGELGLQLHDPLPIWYCMSSDQPGWHCSDREDIRVETVGQWTRGACVTDGRSRKKRPDEDTSEQPGDHGRWLQGGAGNRLSRCLSSPDEGGFGQILLSSIFAPRQPTSTPRDV